MPHSIRRGAWVMVLAVAFGAACERPSAGPPKAAAAQSPPMSPAVSPAASPSYASLVTRDSGPPKPCGLDVHPLIEHDGLGDLRIGRRIEEAVANCTVLQDTVSGCSECYDGRELTIAVGSGDVIADVDSGGRIEIIDVHAKGPRTADSLGVGVPVVRLSRLPNIEGMHFEGEMHVASSAHCGLSFKFLGAEGIVVDDAGTLDPKSMAKADTNAVITYIRIGRFRCAGAPTPTAPNPGG